MKTKNIFPLGALGLWLAFGMPARAASVSGWLNWRGPQQNGTSLENRPARDR